MTVQTIGVLVMSYGTPESMEQVRDYYTHIRRGRPPAEEQLQELQERYEAIGGLFPLRKNTNAQVDALEKKLNEQSDGKTKFVCYQGLKHAAPLIETGVQQMAADGIEYAVGVVLAPHYSILSIGSYVERARQEATKHKINFSFVEHYHLHPSFIAAHAERVQLTLERFPEQHRADVRLFFTAHSLPEKIVEMNDPYPEQLHASAAAIMKQAGLSQNWQIGWQSAGQTAVPWLGPDITDLIRQLHQDENVHSFLIAPIGFVSDHLEILYDIDIECQQIAAELGVHVERTPSLNTEPLYIEALADVVLQSCLELTS